MIPCYVLVPLTYNDGSRVEKTVRDKILDELYVEFGGYRIESTKRGAYRRQDNGKKQVEVTQRIMVAVPSEEGIERLRAIIADIGRMLGQESMYLEINRGSEVQFVPPSTQGENKND
jgi:hypothetical protein